MKDPHAAASNRVAKWVLLILAIALLVSLFLWK